MGLSSTTSLVEVGEVDGAVEVQGAVVLDIDVEGLEVGGGVDDADLAGLDEVVGDDEVLLVGGDLEVVGADGGLGDVGVVKALDVVEVGDVEGGDVVSGGEGEVGEAAVLGEIGVDGDGVAGLLAEVIEELDGALLAVLVGAEGVDDPDLSEVDGGGDGGGLLVAGDELDILDTATVGDGQGADDGALLEVPQAESVGVDDACAGLEDGDGDDEVRGEDQVGIPVDGETVGGKGLPEDVDGAGQILRVLSDDVEVLVGLDEATWGGTDGGWEVLELVKWAIEAMVLTAHVGDEESSIWFGADLISDGREHSTVALLEGGPVRVGGVEVEGRVLGLQERQETTTNDGLAVKAGAQVMRAVAAAGHLSQVDEFTKGILVTC